MIGVIVAALGVLSLSGCDGADPPTGMAATDAGVDRVAPAESGPHEDAVGVSSPRPTLPTPVSGRSLPPAEQATVDLFETVHPSVVYITTLTQRRHFLTGVPTEVPRDRCGHQSR